MKIRKRMILGPVVAVAALGAIIGGTALAAPGDPKPQSQVVERAAEELGIAPESLSDAFAKARSEVRQERVTARLAAAVEAGKITQEESDAIQAWLDSRPAAVSKLGIGGFGMGKGDMRHGRGGFKGHGMHRMPPVEQPSEPAPTL